MSQEENKWQDLMNYMIIIDAARKLNCIMAHASDDYDGKSYIKMPKKSEVDALLNNANLYNDMDEMIPQECWTGDCFKTLFNGIIKELAEKEEVDQWDYFACFLHKLFE